ncbi:MAG: ATP-binding protein, partial [Polyangiales bacterium]
DLQHAGSVFGDPDLVERAFANLAENAFEAMPNGGALTVRARDARIEGLPALELSVEDTGEGMDTLVRQRARDPFFTTRQSGTGLGLAIVERVVRAHGGQVQLGENDEGGTTVTLLIPRDRRSTLPPGP